MIVVSNTSPLTNLAAIGQFDLLRQMYGQLYIPEGVWSELNAGGKRWPGCAEVEAANWIERRRVENQPLVTALMRDLDRGEAESADKEHPIVLAVEMGADLLLLDEKEGRHAAMRFDLVIIGIVGLLLAAKVSGKVESVQSSLDKLRQEAGFFLSETLYQAILEQAEES